MTREYSSIASPTTRLSLDKLIDGNTSDKEYQKAMLSLGQELGIKILNFLASSGRKICLVCTAEDADYLVFGVIKSFEAQGLDPKLVCFWNHKTTPFGTEYIQVAPIIKRYKEPVDNPTDLLVMVKSFITETSAIRTNLQNLIQDNVKYRSILIATPVIQIWIEAELRDEFDQFVDSKLNFLYFAKDNKKRPQKDMVSGVEIIPNNKIQGDEIHPMPKVIKERMERLVITKKTDKVLPKIDPFLLMKFDSNISRRNFNNSQNKSCDQPILLPMTVEARTPIWNPIIPDFQINYKLECMNFGYGSIESAKALNKDSDVIRVNMADVY